MVNETNKKIIALNNLKIAFCEVKKVWDEEENLGDTVFDEGYPFKKDLGTLMLDVLNWEECVTDNVRREEDDDVPFPITYATIKHGFGWARFCEVTLHNPYAINEHGEYPLNEVFYIKNKEAKELNMI